MIEKIVLDYLKSVLNVPVVMEKPTSTEINEFVLLEKTGSGLVNHINEATFAIQSWSTSMYGAAELNEDVKEAMLQLPDVADISRAELNSDYNYTDTTTKSYRYQAVFDLVY